MSQKIYRTYLRQKSFTYSLEEAREELDEFQLSSRELEAELEAQLEQVEVKAKELTSANSRLTMEVEMLKVSVVNSIKASHH